MMSMNKQSNESSLSGEPRVLEQMTPSKMLPQRFRKGIAIYLLFAAVLLITLCSKSSPR